ncbi:hypothetical protein N9N21_06765 [Alphaproteobacteria bacterium]|nr:hypothetical protein [Alphaproteobacteria bacterium]
MQRGQGTNFSFGAVSCRFTGFTHDRKYLKNHAKYHRIAIFTADDNNVKINGKNLFALIASPRGRKTPQMSNVTNQSLKV